MSKVEHELSQVLIDLLQKTKDDDTFGDYNVHNLNIGLINKNNNNERLIRLENIIRTRGSPLIDPYFTIIETKMDEI